MKILSLCIMELIFVCFVLLLLPHMVDAASITIDPGHSPKHQGATSCSGKPENFFNETLSTVIAEQLKKDGITVKLSRISGTDASLGVRAFSSKGTDLLLSIHHDSVQPQFIVKNNLYKGNCSDKASGFSIFVSAKNLYYDTSLLFALNLGKALVRQGLRPTMHHAEQITGENRTLIDTTLGIYKFDELYVLKKAVTPAILLEAAVIINPEDEKRASSDDFRNKIATAVIEMIRQTE